MTIDWWTLALQALNFLILVWLLWRFLYRPVREVIGKRKALAEGAFAQAASKEAEADAARERYEQARAQLAQERQEMLKKMHEELEAERSKVLEQARDEARRLTDAARNTISDERSAALKDLQGQVSELAADMAAELLRKAGSDALCDVCLRRLDERLAVMPADEVDRLKKDLAEDGARLTVVTATPLSPDDQKTWLNRLETRLGLVERTRFDTDPDIVGGAELRFPHAVLKLTLAEQIEQAKGLMQSDDAAS